MNKDANILTAGTVAKMPNCALSLDGHRTGLGEKIYY